MQPQTTLDKIQQRLRAATDSQDWDVVSRLSKLALRIQSISSQLTALSAELATVEASLDDGSQPITREVNVVAIPSSGQDAGDIAVTINWGLCNIPRPIANISAKKASDTLIAVMEEICAGLGEDALRKLTGLRVSRGPLVSQIPRVDYVNQKTGANYIHHPVGETQFFVLTHSSTQEKIDALKEAWRFLGLTPGALTVRRKMQPRPQ